MSITVKDQQFWLETAGSLYQMEVDRHGLLLHLWYGKKTGQSMSYLLDYPDVSFSGSIYDAEDDRNYSTDNLPLEFPVFGTGDYRPSALKIRHEDGSEALDLRYAGYEIKEGKEALSALPYVRTEKSTVQTLVITLKDTASDVSVLLKYSVFEQEDIITRSVEIRNEGEKIVSIENLKPIALDFVSRNLELIHFHGRHAQERLFERRGLGHEIVTVESGRGTSSHQQNPALILCDPKADETHGDVWGMALMYSGSFAFQAAKDQLDSIRALLGLNPDFFAWTLGPKASFQSPEGILCYSASGFSGLSERMHHILRYNVCQGKYQLSSRPVLINNWEATYFDFNGEKILGIAREAAELGLDLLVLDDGWFGKRDSDTSGLGDWQVNEEKLGMPLKSLIEQVEALGLQFGIWVEPEMVSEDSGLYRAHPEWVIRIPNRKPTRSRFQLVLDFANPDVIDYLDGVLSDLLENNPIRYVKWDMNRSITDWYSSALTPDQQKEASYRYVLGLYDLLNRLITKFPDILFEGCSGGGGRFDPGMLFYTPQIWCSDNTDAHDRTLIQFGTSFFYPASANGSHVSAVPNHQTGRTTNLLTRSIAAMPGTYGFELDLQKLSADEKALIKSQTAFYKSMQPLIFNGSYYRLSDPFKDGAAVWAFVSKDKKKVLLQGILYATSPNQLRRRFELQGLDPNKTYTMTTSTDDAVWEEHTYSGEALMSGGILFPWSWGDNYGAYAILEAND